MNENLSRFEEFFQEQESYDALVESLKLPRGAEVIKDNNVLKILDEAAFVSTLRKMASSFASSLNLDSRFSNIKLEGTGSSYAVTADLIDPIGGINKIEYHINKDMS